MLLKTVLLCLWVTILSTAIYAQTARPWNGKQCAVVLTYDDGLDVHVNNALPALDSVGLKATFYIANYMGGLDAQTPKWKVAAAKGHELANHTLYHPCEGGRAGREFVKAENDLNNYSVKRMTKEIRVMNDILKSIDGKKTRTYAFPCGDTKVHDTAYIDYMHADCIAARGVVPGIPTIDSVNLYNLPGYGVINHSASDMIQWVKEAEAKQGLLVIIFHGVGGGHNLDVSLPAHRALLHYLKQHEKDIWVAPMVEVAGFIKARKGR